MTSSSRQRSRSDELDRSKLSLWPVHLDQWQGFVFVNLTKGTPRPLRETIGEAYDDMLSFERFEMDELRIGASAEWMVEANWKIIIENYNECLHCPTVHPELVDVIPAYRKGWVFEEGRDDGGVTLASGGTYAPGVSTLARAAGDERGRRTVGLRRDDLPEHHDRHLRHSIIVTQLFPLGPGRTRQVAWYLFHPDTISAPDFDPSRLVEFGELVGGQDNAICERVQLGVSSQAFDHGVYPGEGHVRLRVQPALPGRARRRLAVLLRRPQVLFGD